MKSNKILIIGLSAVLAERLIYFAQQHYVLSEWLNPLKWVLLSLTFVCIVLYFKCKNDERK